MGDGHPPTVRVPNIEPRGVFLVCNSCGWFAGDVNLYDAPAAECNDCGAQRMAAFPTLVAALEFQHKFQVHTPPRDPMRGDGHAEPPEAIPGEGEEGSRQQGAQREGHGSTEHEPSQRVECEAGDEHTWSAPWSHFGRDCVDGSHHEIRGSERRLRNG